MSLVSAFIVDKATIDVLVTAAVIGSSDPGPVQGHLHLRWAGVPVPRARVACPGDYWAELTRSAVVWSEIGRTATTETASEVGRMLWLENHASVAYRYPGGGELPGPYPMPILSDYEWRRTRLLPATVVLKAIGCLEYQSCEHPGWEASEAFRFCDGLRRAMIHRLPG